MKLVRVRGSEGTARVEYGPNDKVAHIIEKVGFRFRLFSD
jgi:hypothetical protein